MSGYAHRVASAYARGTIDPTGAWAIVIAHDPGCPERQGDGACACCPDISARNLATDVVVQIGMDGEAVGQGRAT